MHLINNIESLQGDPESNYELVHERQISSYGNSYIATTKMGEHIIAMEQQRLIVNILAITKSS